MSDLPPQDPPPEPDPTVAAERDAAQRELAFLKAGVDTESPLGKLVLAGYDGPLEADKIKEFHASVAPPPPEQPVVDTPLLPGEDQSTRFREMLAIGATGDAPPAVVEDPVKDGLSLATEGIKHGMREEEALGGFINHVADAQMRGQKGLTVEDWRERSGQRVS